jgi:uncharacterized protein with HEPN domain
MEMRGMRNKMIHEYFDVDWDVVWATVKNELPQLKQQIEAVHAIITARDAGSERS